MAVELKTVLAAIKAEVRESVTQPYGDSVRRLVAEYAVEELGRGRTWRSVGATLGISPTTVRRYARRYGGLPDSASAPTDSAPLLAVTVKSPPASAGGLVLSSPSGFRLEGLTLEAAALLLDHLR